MASGFFYNMIDVAALTAYKIYSENTPVTAKATFTRVTRQLAMPAIEARSKMPYVSVLNENRNGMCSRLLHRAINTRRSRSVPIKSKDQEIQMADRW